MNENTSNFSRGLYEYSFSLYPESYQPSGHINSSNINEEINEKKDFGFGNVSGIVDECPICYKNMNETPDTVNCPECKHDIHIICMKKALTYKKKCVLCRSNIWKYYNKVDINFDKPVNFTVPTYQEYYVNFGEPVNISIPRNGNLLRQYLPDLT
jgi:hypothetical protein